MTKTELIEKAKRDYPIGTKFKCKHNLGLLCEVTIDGTWDTVNINNKPSVIFYPKEGFGKYAYLEWLSTEWAEIIESPKKEETSLVGRYVKALIDNPQHTSYKKGEYAKIIEDNSNTVILDRLSYSATIHRTECWELMPIGWTPEQENYKYEVVHCKTQEEHQFFRSKNRNTCDWYASLYEKEGGHCFDINKNAHCDLNFYQSKNAKIYSFSEWCSKFNYIPDFMNKQETMFKKGDYIVLLIDYTNIAKKNLIFKQNKDLPYLSVEHDGLLGSSFWLSIEYTDKNVWRYATPEEIAEYDRLGKPYDVTTLQKKEKSKYEIILLNSKEELTACEEYFNKIGYKPTVSHNPYSKVWKYFTIYHSTQQYQNLSINCDYPIATLNKFGISVKSQVEKPKPDFLNKEENNNSIPEYVECVVSKNNNEFTIGKIYRVRGGRLTTDYGYYCQENLYPNLKDYYHRYDFKPSTKEAYEAQFSETPLTPKECTSNNSIIQVGDEVFTPDGNGIIIGITEDNSYLVKGAKKSHNGGSSISFKKGSKSDKNDSYFYPLYSLKLIKKASQTTTTYEKKVAEQPKNVPQTTDIRIPKSISVTLTNIEKEVKLTIKKPKTIKI